MAAAADPVRAKGQQAYMKSTMPFYGLLAPQVRTIADRVFAGLDTDCGRWRATIAELWRGAIRREERYAALRLLREKRHRRCVTFELVPLLEEMVVTGAWWDFVDETANVAGEVLRAEPRLMKPLMRRWSRDENMWKRRVSIICQLGFKKDTDLELLYANIEPNLADREFFIRKAIGWALRQYAWTDPTEVARYVRANAFRLSTLSKREALKNISLSPSGRGLGRGA